MSHPNLLYSSKLSCNIAITWYEYSTLWQFSRQQLTRGFIYNYNLFCELPIRSSLAINIQTLHFSFSQDLNKEQEYNWHLSFFGESRWSIIYVFSRNAYLLSLSEIREIINLCNVNIRSIKTLSLQSSNTITNFYAYQRRSKLIQYFWMSYQTITQRTASNYYVTMPTKFRHTKDATSLSIEAIAIFISYWYNLYGL